MHDGLTFCDEALNLILMLVLRSACRSREPAKTRDSPAAALMILSKGRPPGLSVRYSCFFGLVFLDAPVDLSPKPGLPVDLQDAGLICVAELILSLAILALAVGLPGCLGAAHLLFPQECFAVHD